MGSLFPTPRAVTVTAVSVAIILGGCVTTREREATVAPGVVHSYIDDKPPELQQHFYVSLMQGQRNRVLNDMRIGLAAFQMGQDDLSAKLFDEALVNIEAVYADTESAKKARGLFTKELAKDFKGEPYERAMAYYYRGLLYILAGDYDNARASFKGGMLQDAFAEEEQYRADFELMAFMQGWAARCGGNASLAEEDFKEFHELSESFPLPNEEDNVLVLAETGSAPIKFSANDGNSTKERFLKVRRGGWNTDVVVSFPDFGGKMLEHSVDMLGDVFKQASTRGGREFDSILAGKVQFKATANVVGDVAMVGAAVAASHAAQHNDRDAAIAAGAILLVAVLAKAAAEAAEPDPDTRYWDNLPDQVHGMTLALPENINSLSVKFGNAEPRDVEIRRAGRCGLAWGRSETAIPNNPRAPNSAPTDQMTMSVVIPPKPLPGAETEDAPKEDVAGKIGRFFSETFSSKPVAAESSPATGTSDAGPAKTEGKGVADDEEKAATKDENLMEKLTRLFSGPEKETSGEEGKALIETKDKE